MTCEILDGLLPHAAGYVLDPPGLRCVRNAGGSIHCQPTGHSFEQVEKLTYTGLSTLTASAGMDAGEGDGVGSFFGGADPQPANASKTTKSAAARVKGTFCPFSLFPSLTFLRLPDPFQNLGNCRPFAVHQHSHAVNAGREPYESRNGNAV